MDGIILFTLLLFVAAVMLTVIPLFTAFLDGMSDMKYDRISGDWRRGIFRLAYDWGKQYQVHRWSVEDERRARVESRHGR